MSRKQYAKQTRAHREAQRKKTKQSDRMIGVGLTAAAALGIGALILNSIPRTDIDLTGQPVLGAESAPNTLVVFGDLKCPACKGFEKASRQMVEKAVNDGKLRTAFLHYPFLATAFKLPEDDSTLLARAAECAFMNGDAKDHERLVQHLYDQQGPETEVWGGESDLPSLVRGAGFSEQQTEDIITCAKTDETAAANVKTDKRLGDKAQLQGTPLILLNGKRITDPDALAKALGTGL